MADIKPYMLYHFPLCPYSRVVRFFMAEHLKIQPDLIFTPYWEKSPHLLAINPAGRIPVLYDRQNNFYVPEADIIIDYLCTQYKHLAIFVFDTDIETYIEIRRLIRWIDWIFFLEVINPFLMVKIFSQVTGKQSQGSVSNLRTAYSQLTESLKYVEQLLDKRKYLASDKFSLADIYFASHISVIDYIDDIHWEEYPALKAWYSVIKSRPSFAGILSDRLANLPPAKHYTKLDF